MSDILPFVAANISSSFKLSLSFKEGATTFVNLDNVPCAFAGPISVSSVELRGDVQLCFVASAHQSRLNIDALILCSRFQDSQK